MVYDIPPTSRGFEAGASEGKETANSAGSDKYMGPCPPPGKPHHYHFTLFALDTNPDLGISPDARAFRRAVDGHVLQTAELVGIFGR